MKRKVSLEAIRRANTKLVSRQNVFVPVISDNSKNGALVLHATHHGKSYDLYISKDKIKEAYSRSLASTISK